MKFLTTPISGQHLYLKAVILITGLVSGLDSSISQLPKEGALLILFMLLEPALYRSLFKALRTIVPFLAAYWVFSTLFGQLFPKSIFFTVQVLYLVLVSVYVFSRPDFSAWAYDCRRLRKLKGINTLFVFSLSTLLFVRRFFAGFSAIRSQGGAKLPLAEVGNVFQSVAAESGKIGDEVQRILENQPQERPHRFLANALGIVFLALLVIVHGV